MSLTEGAWEHHHSEGRRGGRQDPSGDGDGPHSQGLREHHHSEGEEGRDRTLQVMERGLTHGGCGSTDGGLREHHRLVGSRPVMSLLPRLGGTLSGGEHGAVPWARTGRGMWGPPVTREGRPSTLLLQA